MLKALFLGATLATGVLASAHAAPIAAVHPASIRPSIITVAQGCGPNGARDRFGNCYRFRAPARRYIARACPRGMHLGPAGRRCLPNY